MANMSHWTRSSTTPNGVRSDPSGKGMTVPSSHSSRFPRGPIGRAGRDQADTWPAEQPIGTRSSGPPPSGSCCIAPAQEQTHARLAPSLEHCHEWGARCGRARKWDQWSDNHLLQSLRGGSPGRSSTPTLVRPLVSRELGPLRESDESSREAVLSHRDWLIRRKLAPRLPQNRHSSAACILASPFSATAPSFSSKKRPFPLNHFRGIPTGFSPSLLYLSSLAASLFSLFVSRSVSHPPLHPSNSSRPLDSLPVFEGMHVLRDVRIFGSDRLLSFGHALSRLVLDVQSGCQFVRANRMACRFHFSGCTYTHRNAQ
jgi:hypothetical protein